MAIVVGVAGGVVFPHLLEWAHREPWLVLREHRIDQVFHVGLIGWFSISVVSQVSKWEFELQVVDLAPDQSLS